MFDEINKDRETHGKKPFDENNNGNDSGSGDNSGKSEMVEKTVSTTDPECGVFHKGEHKKVFAYEAHTACDKHNFILGVHVTPGNIHDSVAFDSLYDDICQHYPEHKIVAADSAYKTPWICKRIFESGRVLT
ncbi:transposase, partial [Butyricicoccus faecihominis]